MPDKSTTPAFDLITGQKALRVMAAVVTAVILVGALIFAKTILAPMVFALVLGVVVSPAADRLSRMGCPRVIVAGALLVVTSSIVVIAFLLLEPILTLLVEELPDIKREVQGWIVTLSDLLRGVEAISDEIENTVEGGSSEAVTSAVPSIMDAVWLAPNFASQMFIFAGTLFFFVLTRAELYAAAGAAREKLHMADTAVARYFAAVTVVNVGLGVATALVLTGLGVNSAVLWGVAAGLLNFVLYLGPLIIVGSLLIAGMIQFSGAIALLPPAAFLMLNIIEAQFVTPAFVGQRLQMNPLCVFLAIVFGLWLWGPIGAIVALPVIVWFSALISPERFDFCTEEKAVPSG